MLISNLDSANQGSIAPRFDALRAPMLGALFISRNNTLRKILIFGNSGSGKTTLASKLCLESGLAHLDLDTLAWQPTKPPERNPLSESEIEIENFLEANDSWVIEGCYTDLLELAVAESNEMIFMNLPIEACLENARNRPWEPHKYETKEEQDSNLEMLLGWVSEYRERKDTCSYSAHNDLFESFKGKKTMLTSNEQSI